MTDSAQPVDEPDDPVTESDEGDLAESAELGAEPGPDTEQSQLPDEIPLDAPEADVAEQARSAVSGSAREVVRHHLPAEANEADVQEQDQVVEIDEEDER